MPVSARKPSIKLVVAALICGLILYNAVEDFFFCLNNNTAVFLLPLTAALQWWLLRSEWAQLSVWMPVVLSILCALLGAFLGADAIHTDSFLLMGLGVPVYCGAAAAIVIATAGRLLRLGE